MDVKSIAEVLGAEVCSPGKPGLRIDGVFAGDRVSDLLEHCRATTLLITNLNGPQTVRVIELMDVPAVCIAGGRRLDPDLAGKARDLGAAVLLSPLDLFETCGRVYRCLATAETSR